MRNFILSFREKIVYIFLAIFIMVFFGFSWNFLGFFSIMPITFIGLGILYSYLKDISLPFTSFLNRLYFQNKFGLISLKNNHKDKIKCFFLKLTLKILYYLIIIFSSSKESFEIVREEFQDLHGKKISIKNDEEEEIIQLSKIREKLARGETIDPDILKKLYIKLFELYKKIQKRVALFSLTGLFAVMFITVTTSLITSFIFPEILRTKAASYGWLQTDWSGGVTANNANHNSNQSGWTQYSSADASLTTGPSIELSVESLSVTKTSDNDFSGGTFTSAMVSGFGSEASLKLGGVRKPITISNSGAELTNYQILVTVDTSALIASGEMQSNGNDIRFKDSDDSTNLPYWIESGINTSATKIWVKVPSIPNGDKTVYMHYNDAGASAASSGTDTFMFFDDFDDNDISDWTTNIAGFTVSDGILTGNNPIERQDISKDNLNIASDNWMVEMSTKNGTADVYSMISMGLGKQKSGATFWTNSQGYSTWYQQTAGNLIKVGGGGDPESYLAQTSEMTHDPNVYFVAGLSKDGSSVKMWRNRQAVHSASDSSYSQPFTVLDLYFYSTQTYADWIFIRNYTSSEPNVSVGAADNYASSGTYESPSIDLGAAYNFSNLRFTATGTSTYQNMISSTSGLVSYWKFDESSWNGTSGEVIDSGSNSNDGTARGGLTTNTTTKKYGNGAANFNGTSNYIDMNYTQTNITNYTIEAWIKVPADGGNVIAQNRGSGAGTSLTFGVATDDGRLYFCLDVDNGIACANYIQDFRDNQWHHVVGTFTGSGSSLKVYADGVLGGTGSGWTSSVTGLGTFKIGHHEAWNNYFKGSIDELALYNRALSAVEIKAHTGKIKFQLAANNDNATWNYVGLDGTANTYFDSPGTAIHSSLNGNRYVRYKAFLATEDISSTPTIDDVTVYYQASYPTSAQTLVSSPYNTTNASNIINQIAWTESLPADTDIKFQIRTSPDSSGSPGAWTDWLGPTGTGDYYTDLAGGETINSAHTDLADDQWIQYKVILSSSDGVNTPTLSDVTITYGNATPEVQSVTASQGSDGNVSISYQVRDKNTATGVTPSALNITLQYCTANCSGSETWTDATTVSGDVGAGVSVAAGSFTSHNLTWNPNTDYDEQYNGTDFKVRVKANDGETVVNLGYGESGVFTLDTTAPVISSAKLQATTTPASLLFNVTDDSSKQMKISLNADLSGADWQTYNATSSIALATDPDNVYVQFKDAYGNTTATQTLTTPETPTNMVIRDLSNPETETYQEFLAWKVVNEPNPGFSKYNIYSSTDGSGYSLLTTINTRSTNYYFHSGLAASTHYYYKISTEDASGNESYLSTLLDDVVDGQGGTDTTPPRITSVTVTATSTQSATIAWTTDELSNSTVGYSTEAGNFTTESGSASMVTSHSVTLTNLTPNTTYYFRVKSSDPNDNEAISNNGGDGYTLTTVAGPVISAPGPTTIDVKNTGATITWNTDIVSDSYIVYSTNSDLSASTEVGYAESVTAHTVTLTSLTSGTKYYYYVHSGVAQDTNGGDYYTFTTSSDLVAPNISGVTAASISDTSAIIQWATNEKADELVEYGLVSGVYTASTTLNSTLNLNHSVVLSGLTENVRYYYRVTSADGSGNSTTSSESNFTTRESLSTETEVVARETSAREEGVVTGRSSVSGGGVFTSKAQTDTTRPEIMDIKITNIKGTQVTITWRTDEVSDSIIEYGETTSYGNMSGNRGDKIVNHAITLKGLQPTTLYNFHILSGDMAGNLSFSPNQTFTTNNEVSADNGGNGIGAGNETGIGTGAQNETQENILVSATKKTADLLGQLASKVSSGVLESVLFSQFDTLEKVAQSIPAASFIAGPRVDIDSTTATIHWSTDKDTNSLVAFAPEKLYGLNRANPYPQVSGNPEDKTRSHAITIYDLEPNTTYHYQVQSKLPVGPMARSKDFTFKTREEALEIINHAIESITNEKAVFRWATNNPTDSSLKYIPYRNNVLAVDQAKTKEIKLLTTMHEIEIDDLESGVVYQVELAGKDAANTLVTRVIPTFSTSADDLPPLIYQVQAESAISAGKDTKIQTIISWLTNEAATSRVYFQKGFTQTTEELAEHTLLDNNFTKKHVAVITKFEPGSIYTFRVESIDSGGNITISKTYTILAPRQRETVFQIIMKNLEQTFGWLGQVGIQ